MFVICIQVVLCFGRGQTPRENGLGCITFGPFLTSCLVHNITLWFLWIVPFFPSCLVHQITNKILLLNVHYWEKYLSHICFLTFSIVCISYTYTRLIITSLQSSVFYVRELTNYLVRLFHHMISFVSVHIKSPTNIKSRHYFYKEQLHSWL